MTYYCHFCKTLKESKNFQRYLFKLGYRWLINGQVEQDYNKQGRVVLVFTPETMVITYSIEGVNAADYDRWARKNHYVKYLMNPLNKPFKEEEIIL